MIELALIIITSTVIGGLAMAIWTVAHEAHQRRLDTEFYAGYMHGLNSNPPGSTNNPLPNNTGPDRTITNALDALDNGKEVMRIGVHRS